MPEYDARSLVAELAREQTYWLRRNRPDLEELFLQKEETHNSESENPDK
ncbi:hypothetical protein [Acetobacter fallax]|uniref:Uncharacterized protein n=1 Tax=Acetobacter fallax TaxID=1737473 RepID=A0ABX0KC58_9PROT|nr:hypothetical protein [Acetobacter fallax]NHO34024.1 hypothetical protein [Acetobacter fallax]NHO37558.1 hypothetical protein [Acetobacter fallax]